MTAPGTTLGINFSLTPIATSSTVAYVVGQIDDPNPGNSGIQIITAIDVATNAILARIPAGLAIVIAVFRTRGTLNVDEVTALKN